MGSAEPTSFGELLKRYRTASGLTQEELAERAGLSARGIQDLERGLRRTPYPDTVRRVAAALGLEEAERAALATAPCRPDASRIHSPAAKSVGLPLPLTSFIGRERELAYVTSRLRTSRLLTLTGPAGIGKTRLALEAARVVAATYQDGVRLADLSPLADEALVARSVAAACGVTEQPERPLQSSLVDALGARQILLVLDNCEHLVEASAELAEVLLRACPRFTLLATSREVLGVAGESAWQVPPLVLPDLAGKGTTAALASSEAVRLFVERAELVQPGFAVTAVNAPVIAQICRRLDGMPLAIELAAARVRGMTVEQIAARLDDRFRLLTGGTRTAQRRQQTLRSALDWSHDLLAADERVVLRRLAVFAGGFTLEAVEAVCASEPVGARTVVDCLLRLVDKSLVAAEVQAEQGRYRLLETVREYAAERLLEAGEAAWTRIRHRDWYLGLAEQAASGLTGPDENIWMDRLSAEHDNLRAAIEWSRSDPNETATELRMCAALGRFWRWRHPTEGRARLLEALARADLAHTPSRTIALNWAGVLEFFYGNVERSRQLLEEAVEVARAVGDASLLILALRHLAAALGLSWEGPAAGLLDEALAIARATGDVREVAWALLAQSIMARGMGDLTRAYRIAEEGTVAARRAGNPSGVAAMLREAGLVAEACGDLALAQAAFEEALAVFAAHGYGDHIVFTIADLGDVARLSGDSAGARAHYFEALRTSLALGGGFPSEIALARLAGIEAAVGSMHSAARLFAACHAWEVQSERLSVPMWSLQQTYERDLAAVRASLGEPDIAAAWAEGQSMTLEHAVASVLAPSAVLASEAPNPPNPLEGAR